MSVTYRGLFDVFLEKSFESNSSIEAGLQCVLLNASQDNVGPAALEKERNRMKNLFYTAKKHLIKTDEVRV